MPFSFPLVLRRTFGLYYKAVEYLPLLKASLTLYETNLTLSCRQEGEGCGMSEDQCGSNALYFYKLALGREALLSYSPDFS